MKLENFRKKIDAIDDQLIKLLNQRMAVVKEVGAFKRKSNTTIYKPDREKAILKRLISNSKGLLTPAAIEAIFLEIFAVSRNLELPERIV